jgi:hypothetical protein
MDASILGQALSFCSLFDGTTCMPIMTTHGGIFAGQPGVQFRMILDVWSFIQQNIKLGLLCIAATQLSSEIYVSVWWQATASPILAAMAGLCTGERYARRY